MNNELQLIDFSNGIKSEEIQHNFNKIQEMLQNERIRNAGYGHIEGLKILRKSINEKKDFFNIELSAGTVINRIGREVKLSPKTIKIELLKTVYIEEKQNITEEGYIYLKNFPQTKDGYELCNNENKNNITIINNNNEISIKSINGKIITVNNINKGEATIKYYVANPRIDMIFLSNGDNFVIEKGIESTSMSEYNSQNDNLTPICSVTIMPHNYSLGVLQSYIESKNNEEEFKRQLYVDKYNELYLLGEKFKSISFINTNEPLEPEENKIWHDINENALKIWKTIEGESRWININDNSYIEKRQNKIWSPDDMPADRQTFLFDKQKEMNMMFPYATNSLSIIIDNTPLMSDQFIEIKDDKIDEKYYNTGIGFKLMKPLDKDVYIEATVIQPVRYNRHPSRFERTATFIDRKTILRVPNNNIFRTESTFLKGENQLEVYSNGIKLILGKDYVENKEDNANAENLSCKSFTLINEYKKDTIIEYKVTNNIYSYDYITSIIGNVKQRLENLENIVIKETEVSNLKSEIQRLKSYIENKYIEQQNLNIENINKINNLKRDINEIKNSQDIILSKKEYIPKTFYKNITQEEILNIIRENNILKSETILNENISFNQMDYINIVLIEKQSKLEKTLIREKDYTMIEEGKKIKFLNANCITNTEEMYVSGIKFKLEESEI